MDLKIISIKHKFKNGNIRLVAKNLLSGSINYYSVEKCKYELMPGDLVEVEPMDETIHLAFNGKKTIIEKVKFTDRKIIIKNEDYFDKII